MSDPPLPAPPDSSALTQELPLTFDREHRIALTSYLPPPRKTFLPEVSPVPASTADASPSQPSPPLPWLTLTYAASLDSRIALAPGVRTALSGAESKAMTHYLRTRHDAILVGAGTARADDPGLNSRLGVGEGLDEGEGDEDGKGVGERGGEAEETREKRTRVVGLEQQPRPLILDPRGHWKVHESAGGNARLFNNARQGRGRAPWWLVNEHVARESLDPETLSLIHAVHGRVLFIPRSSHTTTITSSSFSPPTTTTPPPPSSTISPLSSPSVDWHALLTILSSTGIRSVMIEGGATVINDLLSGGSERWVRSCIVTIAPLYLGREGVEVAPVRRGQGLGLNGVSWMALGKDVVMGALVGEKGIGEGGG